MQFLFRDRNGHAYHEVWFVQMAFTLSDCVMQESEVQDLRLVTAEALCEMLEQLPHRSEFYKQQCQKFLMQF
jgi:isopentenyldiphosphate isomerase